MMLRPPVKRFVLSAFVLTVAITAASCGGSKSTTSPTSGINISGTWRGTLISSLFGLTATNSATLTQTGSSVTGTITCSGPCLFSSAPASGTVNGNTITAQANYAGGSCAYTGTISNSATRMDGTYSCSSDRGTWQLTKQ